MANKLKLFLYCDSLSQGKGGAERVFTNLATEMHKRGHEVFVGFDGRAKPAYRQHAGVKLIPLVRNAWTIDNTDISNYRDQLIQYNPDLFFTFYFSRQLLNIYRICCGTEIPFGMQECTNPERLCKKTWQNTSGRIMRATWEREMVASSSARIRLVMPGYEQSFPTYIRQNVRAFPNSVPNVEQLTHRSKEGNERKRIIVIGGLKPNKNIPLLINAFAKLHKDFPEWQIHNYGISLDERKEYHRSIQTMITSNGLKKKVFFHPPTDDIFAEFSKSLLHVIPSLSEGCPTCVLEAMAHGLPSIGIVTCHGTNRLIRQNKNGLLVENDSTGERMADVLRTLMRSSELRGKLGQQAFLDSKKFQYEETYNKWEQLFYEMAAYKNDPDRLLREQMAVDKERALHMARCRRKLFHRE